MSAEASWDDLQLVQRVVQSGTLSGAARALGVDQTTAARRLAVLERQLGTRLFDRVGGRLAPTLALAETLDRLRAMDDDATVAIASLRRAEAELRGLARVDSVGFILARVLAPALGDFARVHAGIAITLHADDRNVSFDRREADVAVRLGRAGDDSALIKRIGEARFRLCCAAAAPPSDAPPLVRYSEAFDHTPEMRLLDRLRPDARAAARSNRLEAIIEAAAALGGEAMLPEPIAANDPRFVFADEAVAARPIYRLVHRDRARAPAVAAAAAWIDQTVSAWSRTLPRR